MLYDRVLHPFWDVDEAKHDKWAGVDSVVGGGDGLSRKNRGYVKGEAQLTRLLKDAESKGNIQHRGKKRKVPVEEKKKETG